MSHLSNVIQADLYRVNGEKMTISSFYRGLRSKGFRFLLFYRVAGMSQNILIRFLSKIVLRHYTYKFGFQIPLKTSIGEGFFIGHFGTVVISANASIGSNCNISHNVTIGAARGKRSGAPKIGSKVWIGTGAVLVGNIVIGNDVLIAPNSYINFDVPDNSIVIGNPGRIIGKENPTFHYINNIFNQG